MNKLYQFFKDRAKLNMSIDIILLLELMAMAGIGFLIKYVLVSGVQRNAIYGENIDLHFWGLDRHQWGTIHLIISISFLVFIVLHIIFHWSMIICILKRMIPHNGFRIAFELFVSILALLLIAFAFIIQPEQVYHEHIFRHRAERLSEKNTIESLPVADSNVEVAKASAEKKDLLGSAENGKVEKIEQHHSEVDEYEVNGTQTLQFVAEKYNVPASYICKKLNIPQRFSTERLGRLKKRYDFTMSDISKIISEYKKQNSQ